MELLNSFKSKNTFHHIPESEAAILVALGSMLAALREGSYDQLVSEPPATKDNVLAALRAHPLLRGLRLWDMIQRGHAPKQAPPGPPQSSVLSSIIRPSAPPVAKPPIVPVMPPPPVEPVANPPVVPAVTPPDVPVVKPLAPPPVKPPVVPGSKPPTIPGGKPPPPFTGATKPLAKPPSAPVSKPIAKPPAPPMMKPPTGVARPPMAKLPPPSQGTAA
jgi:hypothetical protein